MRYDCHPLGNARLQSLSESEEALSLLRQQTAILWDFDGVIKDSVAVKTSAYECLFRSYGPKVANLVVAHHEANGGMSRYEKLPIYLRYARVNPSETVVAQFCDRFATLVVEGVIASPWVPGVREYLMDAHNEQSFALITATPQCEIELILERLGILRCFRKVYGAPIDKSRAILKTMEEFGFPRNETLMVGDSLSDLKAAQENDIQFLLRRTSLNKDLSVMNSNPQFEVLPH